MRLRSLKTFLAIALSLTAIGLRPHASPALAHEGHDHAVAAVKPAEFYKPSAVPDRVVLSWEGDPKTTQAVSWRTSLEVKKALAEIAVAEANPYFSERSKQIPATTQSLKTDLNDANFHSVRFEGLKPGTKYAYRVGDGTNWSEWFHFSTASEKAEQFSFIYFGDAQNNIRSLWSRVIREAYGDAPKAKFIIHAGDLINNAESDAEWGEWFGAGGWLNAMIPNIPVPGNHEMAKSGDGVRRLSHHWRPSFTLPENGPAGLEESCFTLLYQNVRIIGLNSNEQIDVQTRWLDEVLAKNQSRWVICTFHHPVFSTAKDRDNPEIRAAWKPLFDKYKVDLVLQGHDHTYGRTSLEVPSERGELVSTTAEIKASAVEGRANAAATQLRQTLGNVATGVQNVDTETGTVYVVSVSGPKMYNNSNLTFMKRVAEDTQLYQIIHIDGDKLRFEARTAIGGLYDAFELRKRSGQVNELVEIAPEVPQHLRSAAK